MSDKIQKGNYGEQLAVDFLQASGYEILERNYRFRHAEVDIIAQQNNLLVFVEVKLRSDRAFGEPEAFVSPVKEEKILQAAEHYMLDKDWKGDVRFDIISIVTMPTIEIAHIEDAFY